jgi:hypothetical protein
MSFSTKNALSADVPALEAPDIIHTNALTKKGVVDATEGKLNIGADESAENEFAKVKMSRGVSNRSIIREHALTNDFRYFMTSEGVRNPPQRNDSRPQSPTIQLDCYVSHQQ